MATTNNEQVMPRAPATTPARQGELAFDANASYGAAASHIAAELINCAPEQIDAVSRSTAPNASEAAVWAWPSSMALWSNMPAP